MKRIAQKTCFVVAFFIALTFITSCNKNDNPSPEKTELTKTKTYLYDLMTDVYYWYKDMPRNIDAASINSIYDYFDALLVTQDRWSWMMSGEDYLSSETGIYLTYGASFAQAIDYYSDYGVRVRYMFDNSPLSEKGVKRGYELTHLNGTPVMDLIRADTFIATLSKTTNSFTFKDLEGKSSTFTATAREVNTRSVLKTMVITSNEFPNLPYPVGYFNYYSFKATMLSDIDNAMALFKSAGIKELVLDLRYNGGGDGQATSLLANYLAPASAEGKIIARREHNNKLSQLDSDESTMTIVKRVANSLDLTRIIILTSKGTASASEVILNGLEPLMNVIQIGKTTYGKPNGMYVWFYPENDEISPDYVFLPIAFFSVNSVGYGHYEDGITPDNDRPDDLYHDFGIEEDWLNAALTYITTGQYPALPAITAGTKSLTPAGKISVDEDVANYGIYKVKRPC
ncbi:MAG: S41 family peptidase [Bacteroidales bacterium]